MKTVQQTSTELTLRLNPIWLWSFGGVFATAGLAVMIFFGRVTTLACNRVQLTQGNCQLSDSSLIGTSTQAIPLPEFEGATVNSSTDSDGDTTYQVMLLTKEEEKPFTFYSSSGYSDKEAIASQINTFIDNPQETALVVKQDDRLFSYIFGGIFIVVGIAVAAGLGKIVTCSFDKTLGTLTIKRQGLLGTKVDEYLIKDIVDVLVEGSRDSEGSSTYRVSLVTSSDHIPLTSYYSSGWDSKEKLATQIKNFLNLETLNLET